MPQPPRTSELSPDVSPRSEKWILPATIFFGLYAVCRTFYSIYSLYRDSILAHDLRVQYEPWLLLIHRDTAASALHTLTYLPHTWILLTPLYALGWSTAESLWFVINFLLHLYIWHGISNLACLRRDQRWLFLSLYFSLESVGLTIALGNPVVACMAATVAAYSASTPGRSGIFLALAAIKHSIVYPVYFKLLLERSKKVLFPIVFIGASLLAAMWWARIGPADLLAGLHNGTAQVNIWMHETQSVSLVPVAEKLLGGIGGPALVQAVVWSLWGVLFWITMKIRDNLGQLVALLLIGLLPMHHRSYDLIVAAPLVAFLIRRDCLLAACLVTLPLCGLWDTFCHHFQKQHPFLAACNQVYYQVVIFTLFSITVAVSRKIQIPSAGGVTSPAP